MPSLAPNAPVHEYYYFSDIEKKVATNLMLRTMQKLLGIQDKLKAFWIKYGNPKVFLKADQTMTGVLDLIIEEGLANFFRKEYDKTDAFVRVIGEEHGKYEHKTAAPVYVYIDPVDGTSASMHHDPRWTVCICFKIPEPSYWYHNELQSIGSIMLEPMTDSGICALPRNRVYEFYNGVILHNEKAKGDNGKVPEKLDIKYKIPNREGPYKEYSDSDVAIRRNLQALGANLRTDQGSFNKEIARVCLGHTHAAVYIGNEKFTDLENFNSGIMIAEFGGAIVTVRKANDAVIMTVSANSAIDKLLWQTFEQSGIVLSSEVVLSNRQASIVKETTQDLTTSTEIAEEEQPRLKLSDEAYKAVASIIDLVFPVDTEDRMFNFITKLHLQGLSNKEIGREVRKTPSTVAEYLESIPLKIGGIERYIEPFGYSSVSLYGKDRHVAKAIVTGEIKSLELFGERFTHKLWVGEFIEKQQT